MADKQEFPIERRQTCHEHHETLREIYEKIDKRLPIWVFLAAISIIGAAFSFISLVSRDSYHDAHARMTSIAEQNEKSFKGTVDALKSISDSIYSINIKQAETAKDIKNMADDIEELKQQKKVRITPQ